MEITIKSIKTKREYFPMWKYNNKLQECLIKFTEDEDNIDIVCVSMTAELADGYLSKKEGVSDISGKVIEVFGKKEVYFVTFDGLKNYDRLQEDLLGAAAANWIGTTEILKHVNPNCIFMDIGSTTTDIIPIVNGQENAKGHSDLERLQSGELVYTGMLRTNLAAIVHEVPIHGKKTKVSSELFTISADMHHILGNIKEKDYTCSTPDDNDKSITSCKRRLSRLVCADLDTLDDNQIEKLARYIEQKQIEQIKMGLEKVVKINDIQDILITSIGNGNLCQMAAEKLNLNVTTLENHMTKKVSNVLTAVGAVQMYLNEKKIDIVVL